jgi:hypothetical protein
MAQTAATGFRFRKNLSGALVSPPTVQLKVANSTEVRIGDSVRVNNAGLVVSAGATAPIAGIVMGIVDENGINVLGQGVTNNTGATLSGDDTVTTASDNTTRAHYIKVEVAIDPAGNLLFYNDSDGSLAQTNLFQFFDADSAGRQIASGSASDSNGQFQLIELDPDGDGDASKGLFRIAENQFGMSIDTGTAKVGA